MRFILGLCLLIPIPFAHAAEPEWVPAMKKVHARFKGTPGTFAHFGDSITVTMAFWSPLSDSPKNLDDAASLDLTLVKQHMKPECWRGWKGPDYGSNGSMTIRWAFDNVERWLSKHNPECVLMMFGTNDLGVVPIKEYEEKTRTVVKKCLDNGSVVILTTIPPRSRMLEKSFVFADIVRRIAKDENLPLIDYFGEIVKRCPDDWDGSLAKFKEVPGDTYNVPTLISRDGVHPSNTPGDWSADGLKKNGYALRSYLTLRAYASVMRHVLKPEKDMKDDDLKNALTLYASFDKDLRPDFALGGRAIDTRTTREDMKTFDFEKGYNEKVFRVAPGKGISGGAFECVDVLPRNSRIFYPGKGNLAFKKGGWGGAVSFWIKTNPNTQLKTKFCDPIQITHRGANNGGLWCDFNDASPRDFRMGVFPAVPEGQKPIAETDPNAPIIPFRKVDFKDDTWRHVVLNWNNLDTGKPDAHAVLYVDAKKIGELKNLPLAMDWDMERVGIYIGVNYIGLMDELAIFSRALTVEEIGRLQKTPTYLSGTKN